MCDAPKKFCKNLLHSCNYQHQHFLGPLAISCNGLVLIREGICYATFRPTPFSMIDGCFFVKIDQPSCRCDGNKISLAEDRKNFKPHWHCIQYHYNNKRSPVTDCCCGRCNMRKSRQYLDNFHVVQRSTYQTIRLESLEH